MEKCGMKTEVYSRVVGYYRPVAQWNKGKRAEFNDRKVYTHQSDDRSSVRAAQTAADTAPVAVTA